MNYNLTHGCPTGSNSDWCALSVPVVYLDFFRGGGGGEAPKLSGFFGKCEYYCIRERSSFYWRSQNFFLGGLTAGPDRRRGLRGVPIPFDKFLNF